MMIPKSLAWRLACVLPLLFAAAYTTACTAPKATVIAPPTVAGPAAGTAEPPAQPAPAQDSLARHLNDRRFQEMGDALGDGTFLPDMSSFRPDPAAALGAVYAVQLKTTDGANERGCGSKNPDDFEIKAIELLPAPDDSFPACTATIFPKRDFEERIVKGGADAKVDALVGEGTAAGNYAYEFHVSSVSAVYPEGPTCVDPRRAAGVQLPPRTCEVRYVRGATSIQVSFRQYTAITGTLQYNSVISVEGSAYGSSDDMRTLLLLSGNFRALPWFDPGENGFLVSNTPPQVAAVVAAVEDLGPAAVLSETVLSPADALMLSDISVQYLRDAPTILDYAPVGP